MDAPFVIIGGDAAGMSAASKIKRERPDATVIVFERSPHISYSACGMPYWIGGVVESDRDLIVLTPQVARRKRGIDVRIHHEVTAIDPAQHLVHGTMRRAKPLPNPTPNSALPPGPVPSSPPSQARICPESSPCARSPTPRKFTPICKNIPRQELLSSAQAILAWKWSKPCATAR
jgi:NADPH-dependent 2,4-dienoyl-CoA reductase/sulfur reductase-like enzyme